MKHPLTITGTIVFAGSWAFLLFGSGADEYRSIVNLHKLVIAHAGIVSGLGMMVAGYLADGMQLLRAQHLSQAHTRERDAAENLPNSSRTLTAEQLGKAIEEARAKLGRV